MVLLVPVLGYFNSASIIKCASSRGCEFDDGCLLDAQLLRRHRGISSVFGD